MIAEVQGQQQIVERGANLWQKVLCFQPPTRVEYADYLMSVPAAVAMMLVICGLIYMVQGWKAFKILVVVNAAILGAFLGNQLGSHLQGRNMPIFASAAGAILCAVLAWPMMKLAVGVMAALIGGLLGSAFWSYLTTAMGRPDISQHAWAGGVLGMVTLGLLSFVIFKMIIMVFTSLQGAMMFASGALAAMMKVDYLRMDTYNAITNHNHPLMLAIAVPAIIGFALQYTAMSKKAAKKKKATEDG